MENSKCSDSNHSFREAAAFPNVGAVSCSNWGVLIYPWSHKEKHLLGLYFQSYVLQQQSCVQISLHAGYNVEYLHCSLSTTSKQQTMASEELN